MEKNIRMVKGDTLAFGMEFVDLSQDLTSAYFTVRKDYNSDITFQKSLGSGIAKVGEGIYKVRIAPSDTLNLDAGKYVYDLQVGIGDDIFTIIIGMLDLRYDVTH